MTPLERVWAESGNLALTRWRRKVTMAAKKQAQIPEARDVATPMIEDKVGILHVGIDLGTSRSAIASSNGTREVMASLVGWPKDSVSAKVLGRTVVVGDRVHENRLALNCCFPLKDGNLAFTQLKGDQRKVSRRAGVRLLAALRKAARGQKGYTLLYAFYEKRL